MGTRTERLLKVYQKFDSLKDTKKVALQNSLRLEKLTESLAKHQDVRKNAFMSNSSTIELLNTDLQTLRLNYANKDAKDKSRVETIGKNRKTCCSCCTLGMDDLREIPCDVDSLGRYLKVSDHHSYKRNLDELEKMDSQLAKYKCQCCIEFNALCKETKKNIQKQ